MKKTLNILTAGIFALATGTTILTSVNNISSTTKNNYVQKENTSNETALFNNNYGFLNNNDWITNQSTVDHKFYSYNTASLIGYSFANARNAFLVDSTGNLIANPSVTIPDNEKANIANTKQEMINYRKVTTMKTDPNHSDAYNYSNYQQNYFVGDNNWNYLQLGGLEQTIDISNIPVASKIENNTHLSENLGLYYITKAAINNKISLTIAYQIAQEFINRSSLKTEIDNLLIKTIINLIFNNNNIFKFINNSPLLQNIKYYSLNFIFDNNNNLIAIYYPKWNFQDITQTINYHYNQNFSNINSHDWSTNDKKIILNWTRYTKSWEQFVQLYPKFNFINSKLTINNMGKNKEDSNLTGNTNNITTNNSTKYELQNPYNVTLGTVFIVQLPIIDLYVLHDDNNIYIEWNARVTSSPNLIAGCNLAIDLDNINFQFKK